MPYIDTNDQTYIFFVQEAIELLQRLEEGLLTLRQDYHLQKLHTLMRAAHSIKGGAACVGLMEIQSLAHQLENGFRALYQEESIDIETEDLLLKAYDCLKSPIISQIETGNFDAIDSLEKAKLIFSQLEIKLGHSLEEEVAIPEVELETDITQFLFAEEVTQGLKRWESLLANSDNDKLIEELKDQADVFASLGELLNLPSFVDIIQNTLQALQVNPQYVKNIGKLALADFRLIQEAILSGNSTLDVKPSQELVNLSKKIEKKEVTSAPASQAANLRSPVNNIPKNDASPGKDVSSIPDKNGRQITTNTQPQTVPKKIVSQEAIPVKLAEVKSTEKTQEIPKETEVKSNYPANANTLNMGVRVDLARLDLINNLVGELVTQENSFLLQNQQYKETIEALQQGYDRLSKVTRQMQTWVNQAVTIKDPTLEAGEGKNNNNDRSPQSSMHLQFMMETALEEILQLSEAIQDIGLINQQAQQILKKRQQTLKQVQNNLLRARMLPVGDLLNRFPRMVRDLATKENKQVSLNIVGTNTLIDKAVLEKLYDPIVHLVRNAFDHGIETPENRIKQGKSPQGNITIKAYHQGNYTYIEVQDDGYGIDPQKIRQSAVSKNLISPTEAANLGQYQLYEYLFAPGFSTANKVSEISGRGMGLEAVRLQISVLKGTVTITSEIGKGTTFTLRLPWTLTITKLLVFSINSNVLAIPVDTLVAIASAPSNEIETRQGREYYPWQGQKIPIYPESLLFTYNYPLTAANNKQITAKTWQQAGKIPLLLISQASQIVALRIDQILMEQNLVLKPFGDVMMPPSYLCGCTILGDGRLIPVIDGPALVTRWLQLQESTKTNYPQQLPPRQPIKTVTIPTILVIDDSLTMRHTLSVTLSKGGYRVMQAKHGGEALELLRQDTSIKGVICDLEMPKMTGFEFLGRCRKEFPATSLPIIILTSRTSDKYRQLAKQLGATEYLTKPYLDKELLGTLQAIMK